MRWVLALLAVVVAGVAGMQIGAQTERSRFADNLSMRQSSLLALEEKYRAELAQLRTQRDVADRSNQALQETLEQLQVESLEQKSAKQLYEKIEGLDQSTGLGVDTITRVNDTNGNVVELHITVVQSRGRNRVKGRIGVALAGEKEDSNWREVIVDATSDTAPRFDMRFFQTLVVPIPENDILIDFVEIDVNPDGKEHKFFSLEADWGSILED